MKTTIFLSTTTSATGSMWRTIQAVAGPRWTSLVQSQALGRGRDADQEKIREYEPPAEDHIVLFNAPMRLGAKWDLAKYNFIINTRDPRDLHCNKFWWEFSHPMPGDTPEKAAARAEKARQDGIDAHILAKPKFRDYAVLERVMRDCPRENWTFIGYALYCLHFDDAVAKIAGMFGTPLDTLNPGRRARVEAERVENLADNKRWIGQRWEGSDTMPGRHRHELKPETIATLTDRYAAELTFLRSIDDPRVAALYD